MGRISATIVTCSTKSRRLSQVITPCCLSPNYCQRRGHSHCKFVISFYLFIDEGIYPNSYFVTTACFCWSGSQLSPFEDVWGFCPRQCSNMQINKNLQCVINFDYLIHYSYNLTSWKHFPHPSEGKRYFKFDGVVTGATVVHKYT